MGRPKGVPSYRLHRASGRAIVTLDGKDHYLGKHGSPESKDAYRKVLASHFAATEKPAHELVTIAELIARRMAWAATWYKPMPNGKPSRQIGMIRNALVVLRDRYGSALADAFGPLHLQTVRQDMVDKGWSRRVVNQSVRVIVAMFRDAASDGLVRPDTATALTLVKPLQAGRSQAPDHEPIGPVDPAVVERTLARMLPGMVALVRLLACTGMRPGEVCLMTPAQVDRSQEPWVYRPTRHKTQHRGRGRVIPLGPRARAILTPYLEGCPPDRYIFTRSVVSHSPDHSLLTPGRLCQMIARVTAREGIPHWHPNQLRHSAATELRKHAGIEAARLALGHADAGTTEIYAERDLDAIRAIVERLG